PAVVRPIFGLGDQTYGGTAVRGRTIFFAVLAALSLLCGTAVGKKGHHKVVHGSKHADHMKLGKANNRVYAGGGNDDVNGGGGRECPRGGRGDHALCVHHRA